VLADRHHQRLLQILTSSHASSNNPLFPFDHMSGGALLPIFDVPRLTMPMPPPLPPQQQLSSIEDWLFDEAAKQVIERKPV
jgi:hypothetical protein